VRQRGEEVVLGEVCALRGSVQANVIDGHARSSRQLLAHRTVLVHVVAVKEGLAGEDPGAKHLAMPLQQAQHKIVALGEGTLNPDQVAVAQLDLLDVRLARCSSSR
jgi:hypothetical protein